MPKVFGTITRREQKSLIDFDTISPDRQDYALILICSRIIVRIQLKCFQDLLLSINDIKFIVRKEIELFPEKLLRFSILMKEYNYCHNLDDNTLSDCKSLIDPIVDSDHPLDSIRKILKKEITSKRDFNPNFVNQLYRNLINLSDDLQKYFLNRDNYDKKKHNIRPIYFVDNYFVYQEGIPGSQEETFIFFPKALVWLPTLTISDEINQRNASAFQLRKKPEFSDNKGVPTFRSQLLRMGLVQKSVNQNKYDENLMKCTKGKRRRSYHKHIKVIRNKDEVRSQDHSPKTLESPGPMTSISAILNHVDENVQSSQPHIDNNFNNFSMIQCNPINPTCSKSFDFRNLCPCILDHQHHQRLF
ncbi:8025_t:CDS:1 [Funneliformis mosseae]|uniref:8025_t:CDS:1 n=1 Tax=Funneliformis mosseae TaxID=27381 RepID=A0A9N9AES2_FUNMO|nr:8025_t:CDS:1 [Funneliformis mosseae]